MNKLPRLSILTRQVMLKTSFLLIFIVSAAIVKNSAHALVKKELDSSSPSPRELIQLSKSEHQLRIKLTDADLTIRAINEGTVEVFYEAANIKQLPSFALPKNASVFTGGKLVQTETGYEFILPDVTITIQSSPFSLSFSNDKGLLSSEEVGLFSYKALPLKNDNAVESDGNADKQKIVKEEHVKAQTMRGFRFNLSTDEKLLGGGQRVLGMDRRGHRMPLYNKAHYGYTTESNQMYFGLPAIMSNKGYAIAFDNSAKGFLDIGHSQANILQFEAEAGRTSYIFSAGKDYYELIENFVGATGKQPLPPRWALGNYASRFGYKSQQEVLSTIEKFIEQDFPVDAVVLDLYWFGPDIIGHMGNLEWDHEKWPKPAKMIKQLQEKGVNTIIITEPFILSNSSKWESAVNNNALAIDLAGKPKQFDFYFGNTGLVDVFNDKAQNWFWQYYQGLIKQGVAGWWGDLGEPEVHPEDSFHSFNGELVSANEVHNAYGHKWAEMVYNRQLQAQPNKRPFVMMRAGFIGSQRYGMIPWTGDVDRSWGGLQPQVELALQMSMFGLAYTHSDLGGFAGGEVFDPELYTRWMQYGVFQPVYRPHAQDHIAPEPIFHDKKTQDITREYIKLRYRLLPYNYSLSMRNSLTGIPMMRPLFMDYPKQDLTRTDAYLWGDAFLVSPIVEQGQTQKEVLLPEGIWFDYWQRTKLKGGSSHTIQAPLEKLPLFVKAGAFVPSVDNMQNTREYSSAQLSVDYYADLSVPSAQYTMLEDDGVNPDSLRSNQYQELVFSSQHKRTIAKSVLDINVTVTGHYTSAPTERQLSMIINGLDIRPSSVSVDGKALVFAASRHAINAKTQVYFDESSSQLFVLATLVKQLNIRVEEQQ